MHAYTEIDGVPVASDRGLLTELLRDRWGFDGTVVADYYGVAFLHHLHHVADSLGDAARLALEAGVDGELPTGGAYVGPLAAQGGAGRVPAELVDVAVLRVLRQKEELGLLDDAFAEALDGSDGAAPIDLDPPEHRALALRLAEESVVLLANDGVLPLTGPGRTVPTRVAVVGPNADRAEALFGCYSFVNHVLPQHPGTDPLIAAPTVLEALRDRLGGTELVVAAGCRVDDDDRSGFAEAVAAARDAEVAVLVVGDQAGLFGRGTSGEGCDTDDLELPGVQRALVEEVLDTGTPVVLVLLTGRPYAVGWALERCAAVVQTFFPGEEGGAAVARVLTGDVNPSGRMPVSLPRSAGAQPYSYLHPALGEGDEVSNLATTSAAPFGFGLSYTTFARTDLEVDAETPTDGVLDVRVRVTNTGDRAGDDVVQLYGRDLVASVTRPVAQLLGYRRVHLEAGESAVVELRVPTTRLAFAGRDLERVVEPGELDVWVGTSAERDVQARTRLVGDVHRIDVGSPRWTTAEVR